MRFTLLLAAAILALTPAMSAKEVVLRDGRLLAAFDDRTGALVRLENPISGWRVQGESKPGLSFDMYLSDPATEVLRVAAADQPPPAVTANSPETLRLRWDRVIARDGSVIPITFAATATLTAGQLVCTGTIDNRSDRTIEAVDFPCLGEVLAPGPGQPLAARSMWYGNLQSALLSPRLANAQDDAVSSEHTAVFDSYRSLFCLIQAPQEGLYVGMLDPDQPYPLEFTFDRPGDGGHLEFRASHVRWVRPHSVARLAPVVLEPYRGDWHAGVDLYKRWRATWFKAAAEPAWSREIHAWLELQLDGAEEDFRVPYARLPEYGAECAASGVGAIQLVGWNRGGQDRGNPSLDPEPGLGTWDQLHAAIGSIQSRGVKVVLFGKFPWADLTTKRYRRELFRYAAADPEGIPYVNNGDGYYTPTQLEGINTRRFAVMDILDPAYRKIALSEFDKVLALGASGFLFDEVPTHAPAIFNFASGHGYEPPGYLYAADLPLGRDLRNAADRAHPGFLLAGEGPQDWLMQVYGCSYFRINGSATAGQRYIDPWAPLMAAVIGYDDREGLNLCLLDRYVISYEPLNFKGRLGDFPLTLAYGRKIDALRRRYRAYLWDGEFRDTVGAAVSAEGRQVVIPLTAPSTAGQHGPGGPNPCSYSVFVTRAGKRAVVVANDTVDRALSVQVDLPDHRRLSLVTPEAPEPTPTDGTFALPARSAAVVLEN